MSLSVVGLSSQICPSVLCVLAYRIFIGRSLTSLPRTVPGNALNIGATTMAAVIALFIMLYCKRENSLRDAGKRDHRLEGLNAEEITALGNR